MNANQLVNRMADEPVMDCKGICSRRRRLCADRVVAAHAGAVGQAILAAIRDVLHPSQPRLARLAADLDRRIAAPTDRHVCSARRPLRYQSNGLYTALQNLDAPTFWKYIGIFGVLATVNVILVLFSFWVGQAQIIHWRLWLNQRMR